MGDCDQRIQCGRLQLEHLAWAATLHPRSGAEAERIPCPRGDGQEEFPHIRGQAMWPGTLPVGWPKFSSWASGQLEGCWRVASVRSTLQNFLSVQWLGCCFHRQGPGSVPGRGTKTPQAIWYGQKPEQNKQTKEHLVIIRPYVLLPLPWPALLISTQPHQGQAGP